LRDYSFKPGWRAWALFLTAFLLFVRLGFWQLHRADEKRALMESRELRAREEPLRLTGTEAGDPADLRFRPVVAAGRYDSDHQFLVDNQVHNQQPGYHVLTPLRLAGGGAAVLVNRGWVPLGKSRSDLPALAIDRTEVEINGAVDNFQGVGLKLAGADVPTPGWPAVVAAPDPARLAQRLGYPVLPYQVLLAPAADQGFVRAWREARLDYGKNQGYALQWFLFSGVAAVLFVRHGLKRRE
jgi:surfeit locus 1 family protein